jgi:hypothetical protein
MCVPALGPEATVGHMWNRRTLDMFDGYIAHAPPLGRARSEHVSTEVRRSYVAAIRLLRCREALYDVAPEEVNFAAPLMAKTSKRKEPAACSTRALSLGLRALHLLAAASAGFPRRGAQGEMEWGAAVLGHNLLLRGGELGQPDDCRPQPHRILRGRSFDWRAPVRASGGRPWVIVLVVPIKDPKGSLPGYPTPVSRRHDGAFGADPLCPYDAAAAIWWRKASGGLPFPVDVAGRPAAGWWLLRDGGAALDTPFFELPNGAAWFTSHTRALCKRIASAAGLDPAPVGAKALRIGGATDAKELTGEAGKEIIRRRGRWCSVVAEIYQRELVAAHLTLSAGVGGACGEALEELCAGWAQPAP